MTDRFSVQSRHSKGSAESFDHDHNTSRNSDDTLIPSPGEDGTVEGPPPSVFQNPPVKKPNNGSGLVSVGPRPLMLGTFKITTLSPVTPAKSRPASSLPQAPRTPTSPSARWSSYTPPLTPLSPISTLPVSDELEALKAQLAASEALVKVLMKEKFEAVSASRRLTLDLKNLQDQQDQWSKEKEEMMAKLGTGGEDGVPPPSPTLSPPSEGAWLAGSSKTRQLPKRQASLPSPMPIRRRGRNLQTPLSEASQLPELRVSPPASSDSHSPALNEIQNTSSDSSPRTSTAEDALARIGSIFLDSAPLDDGCDPHTTSSSTTPSSNTPSPVNTPTVSYFPTIEYLSPDSCLSPSPRAHRWSHQRGGTIDGTQFVPPIVQYATPPSHICMSTSSPRTSFNALGASSISGGSFRPLTPPPTRSVTSPPPIRLHRPNLVVLAARFVGVDPCSGYPGRQFLHAHAKSLLTEGNGTEGTSTSINLATALDLHAAMTRVAASTGRPRSASASPIWLASNEPQIELYLVNPLRRSASTIGPTRRYSIMNLRRLSLRRSTTDGVFSTVNEHAAGGSLRERSSPLRMRSFMPSSSPLVTSPINTSETPPKKKTMLSKLLGQGKSLVARIV